MRAIRGLLDAVQMPRILMRSRETRHGNLSCGTRTMPGDAREPEKFDQGPPQSMPRGGRLIEVTERELVIFGTS